MEANPVEAVRNNAIATQVVAHVAGEAGVARFVLVSTDKAVAPATVMGASKALAEFALEAADARWPRDALRRRALRQRARLLGQRGADLPPPDRARRPGDGDRRAHDALLHDDPRGGAADHPLGLAGVLTRDAPAWCRGVRAGHGRAGAHRRARARDDRALGPRPRPRHRHRDRRAPRRREARRGAVQQLRAPARDRGGEDPAGRARAAGGARRSSRCSPRSACWCSRATPPAWRRRSPSCRCARRELRSAGRAARATDAGRQRRGAGREGIQRR